MSPQTWNPFALPPAQSLPLTTAGVDEHGEPLATVTFRPWTAAEQLGYEDAMTTQLAAKTKQGDATMLFGQMKAVHLTLTVRSWTGFPDLTPDGEHFDLRRVDHLKLLPSALYQEIADLAETVQPYPGSKAKTADAEAVIGEDDVDAEDPSRTPTTHLVGEVVPAPSKLEKLESRTA